MILNTSRHGKEIAGYDIFEEEMQWVREAMYVRGLSVTSVNAVKKYQKNFNKNYNRAYHPDDNFCKNHFKFKS